MDIIENAQNNIIKRFITCNVPSTVCNFKCSYCYIRQLKEDDMSMERFVLPGLELSKLLSKDRLGGICYFNLCANGETLLHPDVIDFVDGLTVQGHYVDIITNGTVGKKFDELLQRLNDVQQRHVFIKFSFHYLELIHTGFIGEFVKNINKIKNSQISYTIEITPHDELIEYIDEIKRFSLKEFGALPHITVARNDTTEDIELLTHYPKKDYGDIWGQFDSPLFDFKFHIFNEKRKEFCYAGDWTLKLDLGTGIYKQCYRGCELGNICKKGKLNFRAIGKCPLPHCFNGHALLALGNIPELSAPTYSSERDRIMENEEHWLKEDCRQFFSTKLFQSNKEYTNSQKAYCMAANFFQRAINKLKGLTKNEK
jgi:uncharacterized protein YutD